MARVQRPEPGRLVISVTHSSLDALSDALTMLEKRFGRVQFETSDIPHSNGKLYAEEMGSRLQRRFFSFEKPVPREDLVDIKAACHRIESQLGDHVDDFTFRTVNVDPCILTACSLVMGCHREYGHRIYIRDGVFAELVLVYSRGQYVRLPWTDPDFCHDDAIDLFIRTRESLGILAEPIDIPT
ncbi:MAG: DUF4416 family protein [Candidatus Zixiibacteriota bacterium]